VALSDHEQKLLEQMEKALANEDPRLVSTLRNPGLAVRTPKHVIFALAGIVAGIAGLLAGVITKLPPLGIVGFVAIVAGLTAIVSGASNNALKNMTTKSTGPKTKSSFMQGLEERWDRRNNEF
jgi:hypothetical protein